MDYNKVLLTRDNYYIIFSINISYLMLMNILFTPIEYIEILFIQNLIVLLIYQLILIVGSKYYEIHINIPNLITNFRLIINIYLFSMILNINLISLDLILFFALISLVLDGLDGKLSRLTGNSTKFGYVFDQEVDNILMFILVISLIVNYAYNPLIILIPLYRYIFLGLIMCKIISSDNLPPSTYRKIVCSSMIAVLIITNYFNNLEILVSLLYIMIILITLSFMRDIKWLYRRNKC